MKLTGQRDTGAELQVRRELHRRGYRYRVDASVPGVTRGRPDILFPTERVAIFIDGCFWHRCPEHGSEPASNADWWRRKLDANTVRDRRHDSELTQAGWLVMRFWAHENPESVVSRITEAVEARRTASDEERVD